ncbi:MAG: tetratricopeptide repeat protein [Ignavibacteriaceae bacterium]|nr:tetratricopeptide repeat protein [Ignavibacteriaceae bacterium]
MKRKKGRKPGKPGITDKKRIVFFLLILMMLPAVLYFKVVNFGYSGLDDTSIIYNIINTEGSKISFKDALTHDAIMSDKGDVFYRPMQTISLMLDAEIAGSQPWIYHLSNLLLHILTVIALYFFLKKTGVKDEIAFLLSVIFSISPMFTNAVAWIPARGDLLLCLFSLLSFITFLKYFSTRNPLYIILHAIVFWAVVFTKETSVILPFLILSYLYFVQRKKFQIKEIIPFLAIWIIAFGVFFSLRQSVLKISHSSQIFGFIPFIKNLPAIPITFGKFFIPYNLTTMPFYNITALTTGLVLMAVLGIMVYKFIKGDKRAVIWGAIWFVAFTIPPMFYRTFFATIGYEYFDYRAYLPIGGILLITGLIFNEWWRGIVLRRVVIIFIPIILIYSIIAYLYLPVFTDPFSFFTSAINADPRNAMALGERGLSYYNAGNREKAMADFDEAIKSCPRYSIPYFNKGVLYGASNDHNSAEICFSKALNDDTLYQDVGILRGNAYLFLSHEKLYFHKFDEAIYILKKGIKKYPDEGSLHNNLGQAYYSIAKFDSALYEFNLGIESEKDSYKYYDNRGMAKYHLNDFAGALQDFNKSFALKPDFPDTWGNKGMVKIKLNDYDGAVSDLTQTIALNPKEGAAWYFRGLAYFKLNKFSEAKENMNKALELGYKGKEYGKQE